MSGIKLSSDTLGNKMWQPPFLLQKRGERTDKGFWVTLNYFKPQSIISSSLCNGEIVKKKKSIRKLSPNAKIKSLSNFKIYSIQSME